MYNVVTTSILVMQTKLSAELVLYQKIFVTTFHVDVIYFSTQSLSSHVVRVNNLYKEYTLVLRSVRTAHCMVGAVARQLAAV